MTTEPDASDDFDLVTVFESADHNAELQALAVRSMLEAEGIPAVVVGASVIPALPFAVRVPKARKEEALRAIAESEVAGPAAAEEAAGSSEDPEL